MEEAFQEQAERLDTLQASNEEQGRRIAKLLGRLEASPPGNPGHNPGPSPGMDSHWKGQLELEQRRNDRLAERNQDLQNETFKLRLEVMEAEQIAMAAGGSNEVKLEVVKQFTKMMDLMKLNALQEAQHAKGVPFTPQGGESTGTVPPLIPASSGQGGAESDDGASA